MSDRTIYALYDDREPERWRYVGRTANTTKRLIEHRSTKTAGIEAAHLAMATLEVVEASRAGEAERYWIARCALEGSDIANRYSHPDYVVARPQRQHKRSKLVVMKLKVSDRTKELLIELAGSPRKVGEYLDELVPSVHEAQGRIARAKREAQQRQLAISILESQGDE